mgnify:CR=1 FL=1
MNAVVKAGTRIAKYLQKKIFALLFCCFGITKTENHSYPNQTQDTFVYHLHWNEGKHVFWTTVNKQWCWKEVDKKSLFLDSPGGNAFSFFVFLFVLEIKVVKRCWWLMLKGGYISLQFILYFKPEKHSQLLLNCEKLVLYLGFLGKKNI